MMLFLNLSSPQLCMHFLSSLACHMLYPSNLPSCGRVNNICRVQIMKLPIIQCSPSPYYTLPLGTRYLPQHPILGLPQPMFFLSTRNQVSHPCTTIDKVIVLYVLILLYLHSNAVPNRSRHFLNSVCF